MSKRPLASPRQTRHKKRPKLPPDQSPIDAFFSKSQSLVLAHSGATSILSSSSSSPHQVIDVDLDDEASAPTAPPSAPSCPPRQSTTEATPAVFTPLAIDPLEFTLGTNILPSGSGIPYAFLAHTLSEVSATRSRVKILHSLTNSLRTIIHQHPPSLAPSLYLLSNSLSPPYAPVELGIGPSIISKAIQHVSGLSSAALKKMYTVTGDAGDVAFEAKSTLRTLIPHPPLSVVSVYTSLLKIANCKGQGASNQKQQIVEKLLLAAKGEEVRFLVRTLSQNLRVGAVRTSILTALARAVAMLPPQFTPLDVSASPYHVTANLLDSVKPLALTGKGKASDSSSDRCTDEISDRFKASEALIRKVYVQHPNYDHIVAALLEAGLDGLSRRVSITVGIPILPTLGSPTRSLSEIYKLLGSSPFTAEFKYDGQRAQIHSYRKDDNHIVTAIFSRHLENMTSKYPDIVTLFEVMLRGSPEVESLIMDSEIVAIDPRDGGLKSFQELSNRARKDVEIHEVQVAVAVYAFDLMYYNNQILLERPFRERRAILRAQFPPLIPSGSGTARFNHVQSCESESGKDAVAEFWERAVESRCEGLMVKLLDDAIQADTADVKETTRRKPLPASYEPDKRTTAWLKLKKDYVDGLGDSLDLIPIGAWHGNGRKALWWSPILLGVWDESSHRAVAVCKCMSGFTDAFYKALNGRYQLKDESHETENCSHQSKWDCEFGGFKPEVFFKPQEVWEIRGADITLSPTSVAALGLVNPSRGLSLRFPRFIKVRDDKMIEEASTPHILAGMWISQEERGPVLDGAANDDRDLVDADWEA